MCVAFAIEVTRLDRIPIPRHVAAGQPSAAQIEMPVHTATVSDDTRHTGSKSSFWALALGSIGVVYGDIGTSPLYAMKELLSAARGAGPLTPEMIYGVLSLMLWALVVIVTIKYVLIMLRADNDGEGGTLSLMALAQRALGNKGRSLALLGMTGAALFYGDAMITPAISVLSAVEGLELVTPRFTPYVLHISIVILIALFAIQSRGTAKVAAWFGPIILVWFAVLGASGAAAIIQRPEIALAINPVHGIDFLATHGTAGLLALVAVFSVRQAPRRSMPTSVISAAVRSVSPGYGSCSRPLP